MRQPQWHARAKLPKPAPRWACLLPSLSFSSNSFRSHHPHHHHRRHEYHDHLCHCALLVLIPTLLVVAVAAVASAAPLCQGFPWPSWFGWRPSQRFHRMCVWALPRADCLQCLPPGSSTFSGGFSESMSTDTCPSILMPQSLHSCLICFFQDSASCRTQVEATSEGGEDGSCVLS